MDRDLLVTGSSDNIFEQIDQAEYGAHYLLIHPELGTLRDIYSRYAKKKLESNNEIVVILPYYETPNNVRKILYEGFGKKNHDGNDIDIRKYENEGSLVIMDSLKGYFGSDGDNKDDLNDDDNNDNGRRPDKEGIMRFVKQLIQMAERSGKNGVSVFADRGSFFHYHGQDDNNGKTATDKLVDYELSLPSKYDGMKMKGFCIYHKADFDKRFTEEQKQKLLNHHDRGFMITIN